MDPTNTIVWTRKSFIGSMVSCSVDFQQKLGLKLTRKSFFGSVVSYERLIFSKTSFATDNPEDLTNRNQPLLFFHMDPTNTIVWTR
jgi:hypothetical protein